jgi:hypothetical protein
MQALRGADRHQLMVGWVELDPVDAAPLRIEAFELRRMLIGEPGKLKRSGASCEGAKRC